MATIRKRGDFQWQVMIRKVGFPGMSKTFDIKVQAEAWASETDADMFRGVFIDKRPLEHTIFAEIIDLYGREITR